MSTRPFSLYRLSFYLRTPRTLGECNDYCALLDAVAPGFTAETPLTAMEYDGPSHFINCWGKGNPGYPTDEQFAAANWWVEMVTEMRRHG